MGVRVKEAGKSERRSVMARIRVEARKPTFPFPKGRRLPAGLLSQEIL